MNPKSLSRSPLLGAGRHVELTKPLRFADGKVPQLTQTVYRPDTDVLQCIQTKTKHLKAAQIKFDV